MTRTSGTVIGMDTAKWAVQLHAFDMETGEVEERKLSRARLLEHFAALPGGDGVLRRLAPLGSPVGRARPRGPAAARVRPFTSGNKNDAHDARAICMASRQPEIRPLPVKSAAC